MKQPKAKPQLQGKHMPKARPNCVTGIVLVLLISLDLLLITFYGKLTSFSVFENYSVPTKH